MFQRNWRLRVLPAAALVFTLLPLEAQVRPGGGGLPIRLTLPQEKDNRMMDLDDARVPPGAATKEAVRMALTASGDYRIDDLLSGYKWSVGTITYSFYSSAVFAGTYYGTETVSEVSDGVKTNVRQIMAFYATLFNIPVVEVTETSTNIGLIRFMRSNGPSYAYAYYPSGSAMFSVAGDIHLNPKYDYLGDTNGFQDPPGQHGYAALAHEIGHALGLKHSFESPALPATEDNDSFTIMTYTWPYSTEPATPMMYDLMALQYLYVARPNRIGNDSYPFTSRGLDQYNLGGTLFWNTPNSTRQTIWDSAGYNTLDLTGLPAVSDGYRIDMRELGWLSRVSNYNATGISFSKGAAIGSGVQFRDLVNSSSADQIYANPQPNVFKGYSKTRVTGADVISLASPGDVLDLSGYAPSDVTDSQNGNDRVLGLGANGSLTIKDYYLGNAPQITFSATMPSFSISDASVTEGNAGQTPMVFTVSLSSPSADTLTVQYASSDGTATTADNDYVFTSGTLTFAANETTQTITVLVNGDTRIESNETLSVTLSNAQNSTLPSSPPGISDGLGVGTIVNDDVNQKPVAVAAIASQSGTVAPATVNFSSAGSYDSDGTIASYSWNFGDGTPVSNLPNPSHTYNKGGTYTAVLTVTDNLGAAGTASVSLTLTDPPLSIPSMAPQGGTYTRGSSVVPITAAVRLGSNPASGATVTFSMTKPGVKKATKFTATANSSGVATWNYSVARRDPTGNYTVTSQATYGSQTASSSAGAFFTVK